MRRFTVAPVLATAPIGKRRASLGVRATHDAIANALDEPCRRVDRGCWLQGGGAQPDELDNPAHVFARLGLYPIVTFQYISTTLYQVSYHIQYLFF
jgi:hypothetical protein